MKIRLVLAASPDGSLKEEEMIWTEDFTCSADELISPKLKVTCDQILSIKLPDCFPKEASFIKLC
jgi:hypothetical protein